MSYSLAPTAAMGELLGWSHGWSEVQVVRPLCSSTPPPSPLGMPGGSCSEFDAEAAVSSSPPSFPSKAVGGEGAGGGPRRCWHPGAWHLDAELEAVAGGQAGGDGDAGGAGGSHDLHHLAGEHAVGHDGLEGLRGHGGLEGLRGHGGGGEHAVHQPGGREGARELERPLVDELARRGE